MRVNAAQCMMVLMRPVQISTFVSTYYRVKKKKEDTGHETLSHRCASTTIRIPTKTRKPQTANYIAVFIPRQVGTCGHETFLLEWKHEQTNMLRHDLRLMLQAYRLLLCSVLGGVFPAEELKQPRYDRCVQM